MGFSSQMHSPQGGKMGNQNVQSQPSAGKGSSNPPPMQGQRGDVTYPSTSGQQQMGSPSPYPNTISMGDNASNGQPSFGGGQYAGPRGGKGKGA